MFTEEDIENDGLIKREAGSQLASIARRESPELFSYFEEVCRHRGRDPEDILGERVIRAIENDEYAEKVFTTEINMSQIQANDIREEDIEYVETLFDKLGLNESKEHPVKEAIHQRIESQVGSPVSGITESIDEGRKTGEIKRYRDETMDRLDRLETLVEKNVSSQSDDGDNDEGGAQERELDDIFGGSDDVDGQEEDIYIDEEREVSEDVDVEIDEDEVDIGSFEVAVADDSEDEFFGSEQMEEEDEQ